MFWEDLRSSGNGKCFPCLVCVISGIRDGELMASGQNGYCASCRDFFDADENWCSYIP